MSIFSWFKKPGTAVAVIEPEVTPVYEVRDARYKNYEVEYFPYAGRYYAKHVRKGYLKKRYYTGIIEFRGDIDFATDFGNERDAWYLIDVAIEQLTRDTVKIIRR